MLNDSHEISIPTRISFTLNKNNPLDITLIKRINDQCKNYAIKGNIHAYDVADVMNAIRTYPILRRELEILEEAELNDDKIEFNSLYYLIYLVTRLPNLDKISFKISNKDNTDIYNDRELLPLLYKVEEGVIDLPKLLNRDQLEYMNQVMINSNLITNEYLSRSSYFYISASSLLDVLTITAPEDEFIDDIFNLIDPKIDDDDPTLLIKTDYLIY